MVSIWGLTDKGVVRKENQDSYAYESNGGDTVWGIVCDGMGGANAGDVASRLAVEAFRSYMVQLEQPGQNLGECLLYAAEVANQMVYRKSKSDVSYFGMGTTMVGLLIQAHTVWVVNVGDSRAYYITNTQIQRITRDHSVVEDLVEQGDITVEEAQFHPQRNLITRALGTSKEVKADLFQQEVKQGDVLLLCSDGLVHELTDQEIHQEVLSGGTPREICQRLVDRTLAHGASDNVTVVLFQL